MGTMTKILLGIIITLVIGISIYIPITTSHLTRLNKEMVAKDTVISQLNSVNNQLTDRLKLVQTLNDSYNKKITNIQLSTNDYQNKNVEFSTEINITPEASAKTLVDVNSEINSIFKELSLLDRAPVEQPNNKDTKK